ncbi:RNA polymerase sigma factor [Luteimonas saliphila]|uniref:RNA polymerase sigma factor n=1 Tax=Luteimonas saliphila TaxID=2804919 RepID=UPI00192D6F8C|nr:sigma-70 family RNA polymerase sigma factor [Luteimonas saliphila]
MTMPDTPPDGFTRFVAETCQSLRRYVQRFVGSSVMVEDIVQEAYVRTYEQGRKVEQPKAFLFVTARNLAHNAHRHERIAATDLVGDIDSTGACFDEGRSPEDGLIADEEARLLQQAVERLPPQCRAAFAMKVFQGCAYKEIAGELGISTKTVEKHIAKGLRETHAFMSRRYQLSGKDPRRSHE